MNIGNLDHNTKAKIGESELKEKKLPEEIVKYGKPELKYEMEPKLEKKKSPDETVFSTNKEKAGKTKEFEKVGFNEESESKLNKKTAYETAFITNKEKAGKAKAFELESELKNGKKQDLDSLDPNAKAEIGKGDTKELKKVMELEEKT